MFKMQAQYITPLLLFQQILQYFIVEQIDRVHHVTMKPRTKFSVNWTTTLLYNLLYNYCITYIKQALKHLHFT